MVRRIRQFSPHDAGRGFVTGPGFTLIELLTVVFIVGLVSTLLMVNYSRDDSRLALVEAKRFAGLLGHLQDESVLGGKLLGVHIDPVANSYRFLELQGLWRDIKEDELLRERQVSRAVKMKLDTPSSDNGEGGTGIGEIPSSDDTLTVPEIVVQPDGLVSGFRLGFFAQSQWFLVEPDIDQNIVVRKQ